MYFNGFFASNYYNDYFNLDEEAATGIVIGAYRGLYLGVYAKIYER